MAISTKIFYSLVVYILLVPVKGFGQLQPHEVQTRVLMRLVGHKVLLAANDSISRVLPIEKEGNRYKITFESDFEFDPGTLAFTIDEVLRKDNFISDYVVEVESCESGEVVYGYGIVDSEDEELIPCSGRLQPRDCYTIWITLLALTRANSKADLSPTNGLVVYSKPEKSHSDSFISWVVLLVVILAILIAVFLLRRRHTQKNEKGVIAIGKYRFDKHNMALQFDSRTMELSGKEADLLYLLYNSANTAVDRDTILKVVWGNSEDYVGRTLDVFISRLRKKLEDDPSVKILNIRAVGYKLVLNSQDFSARF